MNSRAPRGEAKSISPTSGQLLKKQILIIDFDGYLDLQGDPASGLVVLRKGILYPSEKPALGFDRNG
jgi:hypothetical protein